MSLRDEPIVAPNRSAQRHDGGNKNSWLDPCRLPDNDSTQYCWRADKRIYHRATSNHHIKSGLHCIQYRRGTPWPPGTDDGCGELPSTNSPRVCPPHTIWVITCLRWEPQKSRHSGWRDYGNIKRCSVDIFPQIDLSRSNLSLPWNLCSCWQSRINWQGFGKWWPWRWWIISSKPMGRFYEIDSEENAVKMMVYYHPEEPLARLIEHLQKGK